MKLYMNKYNTNQKIIRAITELAARRESIAKELNRIWLSPTKEELDYIYEKSCPRGSLASDSDWALKWIDLDLTCTLRDVAGKTNHYSKAKTAVTKGVG
ncbi:hypothetical protein GWN63_05595 [Candidatus Bathyarchaeota archaeon]|nr:hypothetical protein [Candidatus Bathyarchaeota archaeon]NIR17930.1 hypothetical protein [Desulfobacterales bacterium]NIU81696.1 hypothetical protein [Candidatus Bathyarchaeota archaeon]NIV68293.1 hypothetical protein [Candidatus Bathyarchaeota archaeon]NIW34192.1 hypothetical protein [Candidatus Bathyarchaeota archaeon]